jgi:hypothetical protein
MTYEFIDRWDSEIVRYRKTKNMRLITLLAYLSPKCPSIAEGVLVTHICNLLKSNDLPYSFRELRTITQKFPEDSFHMAELKKFAVRKLPKKEVVVSLEKPLGVTLSPIL